MRIVRKHGGEWCPLRDAGIYLKRSSTYVRLLVGDGYLACTGINGELYISVADLRNSQTCTHATIAPSQTL
jgi:hypothetical protein